MKNNSRYNFKNYNNVKSDENKRYIFEPIEEVKKFMRKENSNRVNEEIVILKRK